MESTEIIKKWLNKVDKHEKLANNLKNSVWGKVSWKKYMLSMKQNSDGVTDLMQMVRAVMMETMIPTC